MQWAEFFNLLSIDWQYEPVVDSAVRYRPDFYLDGRGFVEIKPSRTEAAKHFKRYRAFSATIKEGLFIICGQPGEFLSVALIKAGAAKLVSPYIAAQMIAGGEQQSAEAFWAIIAAAGRRARFYDGEDFISTGELLSGYRFLNPGLEILKTA